MLKRNKEKLLAYVTLTPVILIMCTFVLYPIVMTFSYSLHKMKLTAPNDIKLIGLENYISILKSDTFWYSLQNTLFLLVIVMAVTTVCGFAVALILNVDTKISGILTAIAILPLAMPPIVNGIIWKFVFHSGYGFMNKLLISLKLIDKPIEWLTDRWLLLLVVALVVAWRSVPFCAIVTVSGLRAVPEELYEAAKIDGADRKSRFFQGESG